MAFSPGAGKTAALIAVREGYETAGYHVIGMVSLGSLKEHLRCRGFSNATTIAAELHRIATQGSQWDGRTVLIVDAGTAVPVKDLTEVINEARATGAKLIIAGDPNQLVSIESRGDLFEELFSGQARSGPARPPIEALFLLDLLLSKADRKTVPGDLVEEFTTRILPTCGAKRARLWFWKQAVCTIATRNPLCRWILIGGLARVVEWIFRQIGG